MSGLFEHFVRKSDLFVFSIVSFLLIGITISGGYLYARRWTERKNQAVLSATSSFSQVISTGVLSTNIVDASFVAVPSPAVSMSSKSLAFTCQTSTGTFGTDSERIYVANPDAADGGWTLTLGTTNTFKWDDSSSHYYDFNDPTGSGCTDGTDDDLIAGQMSVNPSAGTLAVGLCQGCVVTNVSKGSSNGFNEGTLDSITVLTGAASSDDVGDWYLTGASISQKVPAGQVTGTYTLNLTLTVGPT
jgi:hypothetical protein